MGLKEKRAARFQVLKAIYDASNGDVGHMFETEELTELTGLSASEVDSAANYLAGEGLLENATFQHVAVTHAGVVEIEAALSSPERETHYFPPVVNIINNTINGNVTGSNIQQAGGHSTQTAAISKNDIQDLIAVLRANLDELGLDDGTKFDLVVDVDTIDTQLKRSSP